jgi:hypothetical protein
MPGGPAFESPWAKRRRRLGTIESCATRSQQFVESPGLTTTPLFESLLGESAQLSRGFLRQDFCVTGFLGFLRQTGLELWQK